MEGLYRVWGEINDRLGEISQQMEGADEELVVISHLRETEECLAELEKQLKKPETKTITGKVSGT
jgi:hypothetical protein